MTQKFIAHVAGRLVETPLNAVSASAGAADAGKLPELGGDGRLHASMLPVGVGPDTDTITASENLASGAKVSVWDDAGTRKARNADATAAGKEADGFVLEAVASGQPATVYFEGRNTALTGLTVGARYYLSASTPGAVTATPPSGSGNVVQYLGKAVSATSVAFEATDGVILA